jgi:hypothetical protein
MKTMKVTVFDVPQPLVGYVEAALQGLHYPTVFRFRNGMHASTWASKDAYDCWVAVEGLLKAKGLQYEVRIK